MYMYSIHIGQVQDLGFLSDYNPRTKTRYFAKYNQQASADIKAIRYSSFFSRGPALYNLLPPDMREPVTTLATTPEEKKKMKEKFKRRLDKWLELIPDQPTTEGLTPSRAANSNTLDDQIKMHGREIYTKWKEVSRQLDEEDEEDEQQTAA